MEKFNRTLRGYDPDEVNAFLDQVINQVEKMIADNKQKELKLAELENLEQENIRLKEKLEQHERLEATLNKTIIMAQRTSDQIKMSAMKESEALVENAKNNANRIVNEALLRAEKTEMEANMLKKNINVFKHKLKSIVETQMEIIDNIEKVDF
ncbi:MAG: DivIVA domain-containing protein [Clostridium sp.]|nr:DivIVA domain-containing protein [Clostridium sp.]MCM1444264.1 DivIVA domain-containing protein [Candidatus Amulumruptor caecigallinarius]